MDFFIIYRETNQLLCADQSDDTIDVIQDIVWSLKHLDCLKDIPKLIFFDTVRDRTHQYGFQLTEEDPGNLTVRLG